MRLNEEEKKNLVRDTINADALAILKTIRSKFKLKNFDKIQNCLLTKTLGFEEKLIGNSLTNFQIDLIKMFSKMLSQYKDYDEVKLKNEIVECIMDKNNFSELGNEFFSKLGEIIQVIIYYA